MNKVILARVREFKRQSFLAPLFVILEVFLQIAITYLMADIIDLGIERSDMHYVLRIGAKLFVMSLLSLFFGVTGAKLAAVASAGLARNLRSDIFHHIQRFSFKNIDRFQPASLVTRLTTDIDNVQIAYRICVVTIARSPVMMIFALIMSFAVNAEVSMIFLFAVPVLGIFLYVLIKIIHKKFVAAFEQYDEMNNTVSENINAQRVVKSFVRDAYENDAFKKLSKNIYDKFVAVENIIALFNPVIMAVIFAMVLFVALIGGKSVAASAMTKGELTSIIIYSMQILMSVISASFAFIMLIIAEASKERITEVLMEEPSMDINESGEATVRNGSIEFRNVSFSYSDDEGRLALKNVNLNIKAGETIGIIGGTGSAKSTLVGLIPRLYDVTDGELLVGGINVKAYSLPVLRSQVAMVLQKNTLFRGTVADNIRWGDENADLDEIRRVCRLACADEFIEQLPGKYDEEIYEGAANLSGGQKQRLCIARALIKKPQILILDDSTSAVDMKTDMKIRDAFRNELPNTTKLIIAQRISSVESADRIIVLDNGRIAGFDTPARLLENNEIYRENYEFQKRGGVPAGEQQDE